ncbi:hypothetical protein [Lutibaculum baratangense]|uniref:DUF433 domain-containing protein n=1 Tax=Lutibaculum baratangense AMV1 TaxID=631454 RepID=V4RHY1_9HYPH|nr:hypothetical protein [Lutibaculum baratangense]ESR24924.1 hypothetical protein N177_2247 [Lutibaculum baratangense AMV1]
MLGHVTPSTREIVFHIRGGAFRCWPVSPRALEALREMGLTEATIAQYFNVDPDEVRALASKYADR